MKKAMKRLGLAIAVLGLLAGMASSPAKASLIIGNGSPSAAIPGGTVVDFNSALIGVYTSFSSNGVTVQGASGGNIRIRNDFPSILNTTGWYLDNNGGATAGFQFLFSDTANAFAFNFGANDSTWTLTAYAENGSAIESQVLPHGGSSNGQYFGIQADGIKRVTLTASNDFVLLDNFTFAPTVVSAVPEPSTIALACSAVPMGLGLAWRRRRNAATV